jgi:hypothetical protein
MRFFRYRLMSEYTGSKWTCNRSVSKQQTRCGGNDYELLHDVSPTRSADERKLSEKNVADELSGSRRPNLF